MTITSPLEELPEGARLKRAWTTDTQHVPTLARNFNVSQAAMNTRLAQVGLSEPTRRCARPPKDWAVQAIREAGSDVLYQRTPTPLVLI